jgi:hypothetical protein
MDIDPNVRASLAFAKSLRQPFETRWQELAEVGMPYRQDFTARADYGQSQPGREVYDETGMVSIGECAARLMDGIVPQGVEWGLFMPGPGATPELEAALSGWQAELFDQLGQSNFYVEAADCFEDLCSRAGCWTSKARWSGIAGRRT